MTFAAISQAILNQEVCKIFQLSVHPLYQIFGEAIFQCSASLIFD